MPKIVETVTEVPGVARRRKRPDIVADAIRDRIVTAGLQPDDRVPTEWLDPAGLKVSRGTLREATKILEFQGLIRTKTGPGGGIFVTGVDTSSAIRMLDNLFLFEPPSISNIYAVRKLIEPEIAAAVTGRLSNALFEALRATVRVYEAEPRTMEEEYRQRLSELDFHLVLARGCGNPVMGLISEFLLSLLRDMTVCREIYQKPNPRLRETGYHYQLALLRAMRAGDADRARSLMRDHMIEAEAYMLDRAAFRSFSEGRSGPTG